MLASFHIIVLKRHINTYFVIVIFIEALEAFLAQVIVLLLITYRIFQDKNLPYVLIAFMYTPPAASFSTNA